MLNRFCVLFLAFTLTVASCRPQPSPTTPDGTVTVTSSVVETTQRVIDVLGVVLPGIRAVIGLLRVGTDEQRAVILRSVEVAHREALPRLSDALRTYRTRIGEGHAAGCDASLYAASGAIQRALLGVVETSIAAGYNPPPEVVDVLHSVGGLVDAFIPVCEANAGFRSASMDGIRQVAVLESAARDRGVILRPFPPLPENPPAATVADAGISADAR